MDNKINWTPPELPAEIPQGDMPGDRVKIYEDAVEKANLLFPLLLKWREEFPRKNKKCVISVSGGSGVGKTSIASVLAYYFNDMGIGAYTLSGDNYPRRLPKYNDAERMHRFQEGGQLSMIKENCYTPEIYEQLREFQRQGTDADTKLAEQIPWLRTYIAGGTAALEHYLGTREEIAFDQINQVISQFKEGKEELWLKRMGKEDVDVWFQKKDFSNIGIMILEWTHGNSDELKGIDFPVYLNSTPQETMEFRKARNRNQNADSPFVTRVLEIEQRKLYQQAHKARIVLSREGKIIPWKEGEENEYKK